MRQGTTPVLSFEVDLDTSVLSCIKVVFKKGDKIILTKRETECSLSGKIIKIRLSQEETFLFECETNYNVQIRAKLFNGDVVATDVMKLPIEECLDEEVL